MTSDPRARTDKSDLGSFARLRLPIHEATRFVLVRPHYPENVGAAARAIKTMGFTSLAIVKPGRLAAPQSEMAQKMAVKSWDVLDSADIFDDLEEALADADFVVATTAQAGHEHAHAPRRLAAELLSRASKLERLAIVFGNEKTGLLEQELNRAHALLRIPMVALQPSINLAQAVQIVAYELFVCALEQKGAAHPIADPAR
jgi:TrmH family RNA methyltransferase